MSWFDGGLSDPKQLSAIEDMANQKWDFVAIQPYSIDKLTALVEKMICPVLDMDTLIASLGDIDVHSKALLRLRLKANTRGGLRPHEQRSPRFCVLEIARRLRISRASVYRALS